MQTRNYDSKDGSRIWLSREEQSELLSTVEEQPKRQIALSLGLHGLRTDEIVSVHPEHVRPISGGESAEKYVLSIPDSKNGEPRDAPIGEDLVSKIRMLKNATGARKDAPIVDVSKRSLRNWMNDARDELGDEYDDLGMHDLRRTWATDTFYSLAFEGVPIAEELVMSWGGWTMTATGRETFRQNYLGPVPDRVTAECVEYL